MGKILFYILWPLVWFYAPLRVRVRVLLIHEDEVMCVVNWFSARSLQFPGGGMKFGESPQATAKREILEELGIEIQSKKLKRLNIEPVIVKQSGLLMRYIYFGYRLNNKPEISKSREIVNFKWLKLNDIKVNPKVRQEFQDC